MVKLAGGSALLPCRRHLDLHSYYTLQQPSKFIPYENVKFIMVDNISAR